jgi:hypothetical protein
MSSSENFVSRWSRLKREPEVAPDTEIEAPPVPETGEGDSHAALVATQANGEVEPEFDPASLPSIESIEINTDIRGFLQPRVPPELTRAALRRAWASDPAIRDFIGIAENQWDFNDPTSIFGFGPMRASDNVPALLAQALGKLQDIAEKVIATGDTSLAHIGERAVPHPGLPPVAETEFGATVESPLVAVVAENDPDAIADEAPRRPRQHGGALPR